MLMFKLYHEGGCISSGTMLAFLVMKKVLLFLTIVIGSLIGLMCWEENIKAQDFLINDDIPEIYIKSVNPGYRISGINNVGEMIEISRKNSDTPILLAGFTLGYTNSSGNEYTLFEFPENSVMAGETILLRLASSPGHELAAANYKKTLAMKGGLTLKNGEEIIDSVCWTSKGGCESEFKSSTPTTLVRNLETGSFEHFSDYEPDYDEKSYYLETIVEEEEYAKAPSRCRGLRFSEILSYYETSQSEQFIELYNSSAEQILMDGCQIRYKNKNYTLEGITKPDGYFVYYPRDFRLTKNPNNQNTLELFDINGDKLDEMSYPNGQRKGTAYALVGYDKKGEPIWRTTYAPTPGKPNNYQEFKTCEKGKVINKVTGNCVKVTEAQTRICRKGQYLNILTGRCKKVATKTKKTCKEGYFLNPETNRCRKIKENNGADYSIEPENFEESSSFTGLYAVIGVVALGGLYLIYEFRHEILKLWRKVCRLFH